MVLAWEEEWVSGRLGMNRGEWVTGGLGMGRGVGHRSSWHGRRNGPSIVFVREGEEWVTRKLGMRRGGVGHRLSWYEKKRSGSPVVLV